MAVAAVAAVTVSMAGWYVGGMPIGTSADAMLVGAW
jgi:hypothetical protein